MYIPVCQVSVVVSRCLLCYSEILRLLAKYSLCDTDSLVDKKHFTCSITLWAI